MSSRETVEGQAGEVKPTQNRQYDEIGSKYGDIKVKPAVQPEKPSVLAVLGDVAGRRCLGRFLSGIECGVLTVVTTLCMAAHV